MHADYHTIIVILLQYTTMASSLVTLQYYHTIFHSWHISQLFSMFAWHLTALSARMGYTVPGYIVQ